MKTMKMPKRKPTLRGNAVYIRKATNAFRKGKISLSNYIKTVKRYKALENLRRGRYFKPMRKR